ncbi:unnamed protein product [Tilletia controversa]|uniref:FAD dependent oxidoreductase domain-containing protein n=1 Tax=Tilletia controversa TaxID=13291 RepID=A0A8X7MRT3_9BASI|nr:hypothetical protein A4X06_0g5552 [Tilletia controversa]CAD6904892.1 unnamed protein product [Tilletia controversa]CAD6961627.1 unnamed protein product [Tilletia controversa]CAD6972097.1 unnamed protein product [Tilletia controversa]
MVAAAAAASPVPVPERHIVVVGGGVIGAATAYYLASHPGRHAARITVCETSYLIAPGASSKSGGFLASDWHDHGTASLAALSFRLHSELAEEHDGEARWAYRRLKTYEADIDNTIPPQHHDVRELDWIDPRVLASELDLLGDESTTAQVTPGLLSIFLLEHARDRLDVDLLLGTAVRSIHTGDDGRVTSLTVSREGDVVDEIQATDIIVCAGPWTGAFFKVAIDPTSPLQRLPFVKTASRIGGQRAHSIVVRGTRPVGNHALFVNKISYLAARSATKAGNPELYCRPDGTVYVCGAPDGEELPHTADDVDFSERQVEKLIEQTAVVAPQVFGPDAEIVVRQACFLPMSEATKNPIINYSPQHGLGVAAGHTCWGITLSLGTGKVMAELIFDGRAHSADVRALDGLKVRAE